MSWWRTPRVFLAPAFVLILVAIGGRYTLDRAGFTTLGWVDLRVVGLLAGFIVLVVDLARRPRARRAYRPEGWLVAVGLFFLYQIASGLWAPPGARLGEKTLDIVLMAALTVAIYLYTLGDPAAAVRTTFLLFYVAAIVFAVGALLAGPGVQGRYSAFGGGPNVFVRIQILGISARSRSTCSIASCCRCSRCRCSCWPRCCPGPGRACWPAWRWAGRRCGGCGAGCGPGRCWRRWDCWRSPAASSWRSRHRTSPASSRTGSSSRPWSSGTCPAAPTSGCRPRGWR